MSEFANSVRSGARASRLSRWSLQRLNIQGYGGLSYEERRAISLGLRLTTGLCMAAFLAALVVGSPWAVAALVPIALTAGLTPRHPFDFAWQHGVRHLVGGAPLPPNPVERRIAFLIATPWLLGIAALLGGGWTMGAYAAAVPLAASCAIVTLTHLCVPGTLIAVARGRVGLLWREIPTT